MMPELHDQATWEKIKWGVLIWAILMGNSSVPSLSQLPPPPPLSMHTLTFLDPSASQLQWLLLTMSEAALVAICL